MSGLSFTKLFKSILESTLWVQQPNHVRVTWITMLAMADSDGMVASSIPGLAARARVTVEECEEALKVFLSPDKYSRTPDHEGRRIREIKGGWELLNYECHRRQIAKEQNRHRSREYMRKHRAKVSAGVAPSTDQHLTCNGVGGDVEERGDFHSLSSSLSPSDPSGSPDPDPDPEQAPRQPKRPGAIFAPGDLEMNQEQLVRCQELRFDPDEILRDFKLQEFNRSYTDWPRRLSKWIEQERINRETEAAAKIGRNRSRAGPNDALQAQADRVSMLRAQEAAEEARKAPQ